MPTLKPGYQLILDNVAKHIQLEKKEIEYFIAILQHKKIRKRQYLLQAGDICRYEHFVIKGCLRAYYVDENGFDYIVQFAVEDWWTGDMASFLTGTPATLNIDALEDSEVLMIEKKDIDELFVKVPKFERFFRILMQNAFVAQQQRILLNLSKTADERYLLFRQKYPLLEKRLPQHQIASYLGITPEFLSKIRKNLSKKKK